MKNYNSDYFNTRLTENELSLKPADIDFLTKYPIEFMDGNFADYIWGGYNLYELKELPYDKDTPPAAESWEASGHRKYPSRILMPDGKIFLFMELLKDRRLAGLILGNAIVENFGQDFPVLAKFVDVHKHMSVHLHPSPETAKALGEKDPGKEEIFIVLSLHKNAESALYLGLKNGATREIFEAAVGRKDDLLELSHKIYVKPGDIFRIPSGVPHCWTGGSIAVEITESSDLTYRLYDFRRQRPMHIQKGLASIDHQSAQGAELEEVCRLAWQAAQQKGIDYVATRNALRVERLNVCPENNSFKVHGCGSFEVLMGIEGAIEIMSLNDDWSIILKKARSMLIPASLKGYRVRGVSKENNSYALRITMKASCGQ